MTHNNSREHFETPKDMPSEAQVASSQGYLLHFLQEQLEAAQSKISLEEAGKPIDTQLVEYKKSHSSES